MDEAATTLSKDDAKAERIAMRAARIQAKLEAEQEQEEGDGTTARTQPYSAIGPANLFRVTRDSVVGRWRHQQGQAQRGRERATQGQGSDY